MKDMDAMTLAVVRDRMRSGRKPPRDIVLAFLADEEAGGTYGARHLVDQHPDLFEGVTEAIGEVGGFSFTVNEDLRFYLIETAEKGMHWMRLTVDGTAGHGSMTNKDNAITELSEAVARLGRHQFPVRLTKSVRGFLDELSDAFGVELDPEDMEETLAKLGGIAKMIGTTLRNTAQPTMLGAGYKVNVIPGQATAHVDGRFLPGYEEEFLTDLDRILGPRVRRETLHSDKALETGFDGSLVDAIQASLHGRGPDRPRGPVHALRRHGRQVLLRPGHPLLRLRPAAAAARAGLRRDVPRRGRAGPGGRPAVRRAGPRPLHRQLLIIRLFVPVPVVSVASTGE